MKLEARKLSLKRTESQKVNQQRLMSHKDQKAVLECAQQLRKLGDMFNKYIMTEKRAKMMLSDPKVK